MFTSWESGRKNHYYFVTTKKLENEAEKFVDEMFDKQLQLFGKKWCLRIYGMRKDDSLPCQGTIIVVSRTIKDYIKTLGIDEEEELIKNKAPPQPSRPKQKRAIIEFGNQKGSAWKTPLFGDTSNNTEATTRNNFPSLGTFDETSATISTDRTNMSKGSHFCKQTTTKQFRWRTCKGRKKIKNLNKNWR